VLAIPLTAEGAGRIKKDALTLSFGSHLAQRVDQRVDFVLWDFKDDVALGSYYVAVYERWNFCAAIWINLIELNGWRRGRGTLS
jgi:hypothetical protein